MKEVIVTKHALKRLKERVGLPRRACQGTAQRAFDQGLTHRQARGRLKRWISKLFREHGTANATRVYGRHVYLFAGSTLITVLHLPKDMEGAMRKSG